MDDATLKLLIGLTGAAAGALAAAAANMYAANRKIKEIELSYYYKLQDGYLENARKFADKVYVPINKRLTDLSNAYNSFFAKIDFNTNHVPEGSHNSFVGRCRKYLSEIDKIFDHGADAYLTTELDTRLQEFNSFIRESIDANAPIVKSVFEAEASLLSFRIGLRPLELISRSRAAMLTSFWRICNRSLQGSTSCPSQITRF